MPGYEVAAQWLSVLILALGAVILAVIAYAVIQGLLVSSEGRERLTNFLAESPGADGQPGKPSISRLQMIVWNFVVAFAFLYVVADAGQSTSTRLAQAIEALFSWQILALLGISNGTYLAGKMTRQAGAATPAAGDPEGSQAPGQPVG